MSDPVGLEAPLSAYRRAYSAGVHSRFPHSAGALLDRLGSLYRLHGEVERVRRVVESLAAVPMETSVSLRPGMQTELRLTLGIPPRPGDPDSRLAVVAALSGLGAGRVSAAVDEALASVAPTPARR